MANLFIIEFNRVIPNPEALLLEPFKTIWERDPDDKKVLATKELSFVEFMASVKPSNPFREAPVDKKQDIIIKELFKKQSWSPDKLVSEAIDKVKKMQEELSFTFRFWEANKNVLEKTILHYNKLDLNAKNFKTGAPLYKPKEITDGVINAEKVMASILALRDKVDAEIFSNSKNKGKKEVSSFQAGTLSTSEAFDNYFVEDEDEN